jgi:biopolymer transport protein ExbB/TolQ
MSFIDFLKEHWLHVLPILIAGAFAIAITMERFQTLFRTYPLKNTTEFFDTIGKFLVAGQVQEAIVHCDKMPQKPAVAIVKQALLRAHQPEPLIESTLEISIHEAQQSIQKRTAFLSTIANVATLLGLFGTIAGLISSFEAVGAADPQQKSALLAAGISTAMNATMMGLAVAIPCMVAFSFLMSQSNRLVSEVEQSAIRVLDLIKQRYYCAQKEIAEEVA